MVKDWLLERAREPSTLKGLTCLAGVAGYAVSPELLGHIAACVTAVVGLIDILRKEKKGD